MIADNTLPEDSALILLAHAADSPCMSTFGQDARIWFRAHLYVLSPCSSCELSLCLQLSKLCSIIGICKQHTISHHHRYPPYKTGSRLGLQSPSPMSSAIHLLFRHACTVQSTSMLCCLTRTHDCKGNNSTMSLRMSRQLFV